MNWNIRAGGFASYDPDALRPCREAAIQSVIEEQHQQHRVATTVLVDAYRWDEVYGDGKAIAKHLGYRDGRFTRLEDKRLIRNNGAGIGVACVTDEKIATSSVLDLVTRNALRIVFDTGTHGLQLAMVYADDLDEDVRHAQIGALHAQLEPDVPTVLTGDFNALRADLKGAKMQYRLGDIAVRALAHLAPPTYTGRSIRGMNRRSVVPCIESLGYRDADPFKRPTAPSRLPLLGVDYAFYNEGCSVDNFNVLNTERIRVSSDHLPVRFDVRVLDRAASRPI